MKKLFLIVFIHIIYVPFSFGFLVPNANCVVPDLGNAEIETESVNCNEEAKAERLSLLAHDNREVSSEKYADVQWTLREDSEAESEEAGESEAVQ